MSAASIQAKIKKGLARAINKTGSSTSDLVYRVRKTQTGTPLAPVTTSASVLLVDAIFKSYDKFNTDINILSGDRKLVSNSDIEIVQGDLIKQGSINYIVIAVDVKAPTSDVLVYIAQVRQQ